MKKKKLIQPRVIAKTALCRGWTKSAKIDNAVSLERTQEDINRGVSINQNPINDYVIVNLGESYAETEMIELFDAIRDIGY